MAFEHHELETSSIPIFRRRTRIERADTRNVEVYCRIQFEAVDPSRCLEVVETDSPKHRLEDIHGLLLLNPLEGNRKTSSF